MLETVWQDVRYVLRSLRRAPGFALVSIGSLAVGVGFAVFTFNFVQQALAMSTVPAVRSGRLVDVFTNQLNGTAYGTSSYPDIQDIRSRSDIFDAVVAYSPYSAALNVDGATRMAFGEIVTGNYFRVLGIETMLGRPIVPADDQPGAPRVVVLSPGAWRRHFGSSRSVLGRVLRIRNQSYTIVGVASSGYSGAAFVPVDFWTAMTWAEDAEPVGIIDTTPSPGKSRLDRRGDRWLFVKGRLAPGQTAASTRTALEALMTRLGTEYPATNAMRRFTTLDSRAVRIHPVVDFAIAPASTALGVVVLLVLAVVSTNVSGLLLARGTARQREIAIRFAVGASRSRVVRHLLTESVLVAAIGGGAALWLMWTLTVIGRDIATIAGAPFTIEPRLGTSSLWFGVALALATGIAAGLAPALRTTIRSRLLLTGSSPLASTRHSRWTLRDLADCDSDGSGVRPARHGRPAHEKHAGLGASGPRLPHRRRRDPVHGNGGAGIRRAEGDCFLRSGSDADPRDPGNPGCAGRACAARPQLFERNHLPVGSPGAARRPRHRVQRHRLGGVFRRPRYPDRGRAELHCC